MGRQGHLETASLAGVLQLLGNDTKTGNSDRSPPKMSVNPGAAPLKPPTSSHSPDRWQLPTN
jgi:hypothetical protein